MDDLFKYTDEKNFENFINSFEDINENAIFFNMPIKSDNEELNYYRYSNIIKYFLNKLKLKFKEKKNEIQKENIDEYIKENKYKQFIENQMNFFFHKMKNTKDLIEKNILDKERIEYLIILTSKASDITGYDFCYNLITSKDLAEKEIDEYKLKNNYIDNYISNNNNANNNINNDENNINTNNICNIDNTMNIISK